MEAFIKVLFWWGALVNKGFKALTMNRNITGLILVGDTCCMSFPSFCLPSFPVMSLLSPIKYRQKYIRITLIIKYLVVVPEPKHRYCTDTDIIPSPAC